MLLCVFVCERVREGLVCEVHDDESRSHEDEVQREERLQRASLRGERDRERDRVPVLSAVLASAAVTPTRIPLLSP